MKLSLPIRLCAVFLLFATVPLLYNNCSELKFGSAEEASPLNSSSVGPPTDQEIIDQLPPDEQDIFRPISDIEKDPNLITVYRCSSDSVYICHFPNNTESAHTLCVGLSAVGSHQQHEVQLDGSGGVLLLSDYLGPCKH